MIVLRFSGVFLSYIATLLITNNFEEKEVGKYNLLLSLSTVFSAFVIFGVDKSFLQFSGKLKAEKKSQYLKKLYINDVKILIISFFALLTLFYLSHLFFYEIMIKADVEDTLFQAIWLSFFLSLLFVNFEVIRGIDMLYLSEVFRNVLRYVILIIGVVFLVYNNRYTQLNNYYIGIIVFLSIISTIIISYKLKTMSNGVFLKNNDRVGVKKILNISYPIAISSIINILLLNIDLILLKHYYTYEVVAYYGVVLKLSAVIGVVLLATNAYVAPKIAEYYFSKRMKSLKKMLNTTILINMVFTIPMIIIFVLYSSQLLGFFGKGYEQATLPFRIILIGQLVNSLCGPVALYFNMTGKQKILRNIFIIALIVNVLVNLALIPRYGMTGAAIASSVSLILWNIVGLCIVYKKDNVILTLNWRMIKLGK